MISKILEEGTRYYLISSDWFIQFLRAYLQSDLNKLNCGALKNSKIQNKNSSYFEINDENINDENIPEFSYSIISEKLWNIIKRYFDYDIAIYHYSYKSLNNEITISNENIYLSFYLNPYIENKNFMTSFCKHEPLINIFNKLKDIYNMTNIKIINYRNQKFYTINSSSGININDAQIQDGQILYIEKDTKIPEYYISEFYHPISKLNLPIQKTTSFKYYDIENTKQLIHILNSFIEIEPIKSTESTESIKLTENKEDPLIKLYDSLLLNISQMIDKKMTKYDTISEYVAYKYKYDKNDSEDEESEDFLYNKNNNNKNITDKKTIAYASVVSELKQFLDKKKEGWVKI